MEPGPSRGRGPGPSRGRAEPGGPRQGGAGPGPPAAGSFTVAGQQSASLARRPEEQEQAADQAADMTGANMGEVEAAATRNGGGAVTAASAVASCPPDGGARAWMVLAASFLCNGLLFGIINTYGVIYVYLLMDLEKAKVPDAASKACE